jgi:hypothetical protein
MLLKGPYYDTDFGTRKKRKDIVKSILACLSEVRDAEKRFLDKTYDSFRSSDVYETGEEAVGNLDEIIDLLADVY